MIPIMDIAMSLYILPMKSLPGDTLKKHFTFKKNNCMKLQINRPVAFFDLETTGVNVTQDRIIEIAILKVHPNEKKESLSFLLNPGVPIPTGSTEIHGITDKDVEEKPYFKEVAEEIVVFLDNCDLGGFNCNRFDIPLIVEEFLRVGIDFDIESRKIIDVQTIFHKMEKRTLEAAYQFYCGKELTDAHSAKADTEATYDVLEAQLDKYKELDNTIDFLDKFSVHHRNADLMGRIVYDKENREIFNFGKHKGKPVEQVLKQEPGYYGWMMNGDFPQYTKKVLTRIREKIQE